MRQRGASGGGLRHTLLRLRFIPYEPDAVSTAEGIVHLAAREPHGRDGSAIGRTRFVVMPHTLLI